MGNRCRVKAGDRLLYKGKEWVVEKVNSCFDVEVRSGEEIETINSTRATTYVNRYENFKNLEIIYVSERFGITYYDREKQSYSSFIKPENFYSGWSGQFLSPKTASRIGEITEHGTIIGFSSRFGYAFRTEDGDLTAKEIGEKLKSPSSLDVGDRSYVYFVKYNDEIVYIGSGQGNRVLHVTSGTSHNYHLNKLHFSEEEVEIMIAHKNLPTNVARGIERVEIANRKPKFNSVIVDILK